MTFLTILEVTELCSLKLVLEGKTGKEVHESLVVKGGHTPLSRNPRCPHLL